MSLVNSFNVIFIFLFTALASSGAVAISQYIGQKTPTAAEKASSQLLMVSTVFSIFISLLVLWGNETLMGLLFGKVEPETMDACVIYLRITAYSYPALAVYNAGAAMYRSFGKTSTTMYISIAANSINVVGNLSGVFILKIGVAGVAYPTLLARAFSAVVVTILCFSKRNPIYYEKQNIFTWDGPLLWRVLGIAVPNGVESGIFQFVKVALSNVVALFGTHQIAANDVAQSIWSMAALVTSSIGPVFITVIGQTMGAGDVDGAEREFKRLIKITLLFSLAWNGLIFAVTPILMRFYAVEPETKTLVILLVLIHNIFNALAFPSADSLGKGLRAAGDVRFPTVISIFTPVGVRLVFSLLFAIGLDWSIRGVIFYLRFRSKRWANFRVI